MTRPADTRIVIGRYTLCSELASGGMGTVHFATWTEGKEKHVVAAKRLHPHLRNDAELATMLLDEARLAVSIRHPNVVEVLDIVSTSTDLLLVMEYVPGLSLHELMTTGMAGGRRALVPLRVAMTIAVDGLHGLQAAHEAVGDNGQPLHLIHRDVSPQNLLVGSNGITKLADFGVAKAAGRLRSTHDGSIRGKIAYMSPEQVADEELDARSDVYSYAVVLWEMLAGRPMFEADNEVALFAKAMRGPTQRLAEVAPDVPPAIDKAVWRALSRDPRRRFPTARAFADALVEAFGATDRTWVAEWAIERAPDVIDKRSRIVSGLLTREEETITGFVLPAPAAPAPAQAVPALLEPSPPPKSRRLPFALGAIGLLGVVGVALLLGGWKRPPPPEPAAVMTVTELDSIPPPPSAPAPAAAESAEPRPRTVATTRTTLAPAPARPRAGRKPDKDPKADCNPPYTEDEQGKHFKPWCLR